MWENIVDSDTNYYSVLKLQREDGAMEGLRKLFPNGKANELNVILFSTSGVHGTYTRIEEVEAGLRDGLDDLGPITFLVIHPRTVTLRYGNCTPESQDDIDFLKGLRESSAKVLAEIGF
jgi:hypothetical protein